MLVSFLPLCDCPSLIILGVSLSHQDLLNEDLVAVAPGYTFGDQTLHHVRVSLASSEEDLREGIARICRRVISNRK